MGRQCGLADREDMRVKIRPVRDGDVKALIALWQDCDLVRPWNDARADIARARAAPESEIFVIPDGRRIAASVMAGHDGHRGWVYYVATAPARRGEGLGNAMMDHAEAWLKSQGAVKVNLMIRSGNPVVGFYREAGYAAEDREVMAKWLVAPPQRDAPEEIEVTITYLEMRAPPSRLPAMLPRSKSKIALLRATQPTVGFYRYLYNAVGAPWRWYERNLLSDEDLTAIIADGRVEIYVLYCDGAPAGYAELDRRQDGEIELAYFGLIPDYIGRGLGGYMLDWAVDTAWSRRPERVWVHTCTLDHPTALAVYQKAGFVAYDQETVTIEDPGLPGFG
jgi:GNAT superfamily N-acetyltransferase